MSSKKDILSRYKSNPSSVYQSISGDKKKKKKGIPKHQQLMIIDEDDGIEETKNDDFGIYRNVSIWATGKARNLQEEEEELEEAGMEVLVDHEANFKSAFTSSNWNTVAEEEGCIDNRGREMNRSRSSPSQSPSPRRRSSPSLSPSPRKKSLSISPSPSQNRRMASPSLSPSPERKRDQNRSPSPVQDETREKILKMSDGTLAGLQSGEAIKQQLHTQRAMEQKAYESSIPASAQQTVYRDTKTGKKVDLEARQRELANLQALKEEKERKEKDWGRGLIQTKQELAQKHRLMEEKSKGLAVYADDTEHNQVLKEQVRWGDTMAQHVSKSSQSNNYKKNGRRAVYQGPAPTPNRYSIPPGYRWDGVDRSNGFELKVFRAKHQFAEVKKEYNRWAMEDM